MIYGADLTKNWTMRGRNSNNNKEQTTIQLVGENLVKENIYIDGERLITDTSFTNVRYGEVFMGPDHGKKCVEFELNSDLDVNVNANKVINVDTMSESGKIKLVNFPLENIDNMRIEIMKSSGLNQAITIDTTEG